MRKDDDSVDAAAGGALDVVVDGVRRDVHEVRVGLPRSDDEARWTACSFGYETDRAGLGDYKSGPARRDRRV